MLKNFPSFYSPKVGEIVPPDPPKLRLKSLNGQVFTLEGDKVGEEFSLPLENMSWDLTNINDYTIHNALDLYSPPFGSSNTCQ